MTNFRRLALASLISTFVLVAIGGLVRASKSGLGCGTSWPDCPGNIDRALIIELSHRAAAGVVTVLIGLLAVAAWRNHRSSPRLLRASAGAFGLVLFQALLGAVVVKLELEAESVVMHLATAMALVALLIYIHAAARVADERLRAEPDEALSRRSAVVAFGVLVLLLVGSYVTGRGAGLAFEDWPLMNGRLIPDLAIEQQALHFLHRALAALVGVAVIAFAIHTARTRAQPMQTRLAAWAGSLFALELLLGAANVWTRLNTAVVTAHLFVAALIWGSLVALSVITSPALARALETREAEALHGPRPAMDPGA